MGDTEEEIVPFCEELMDLSNIGRTVDGTGWAYLKLNCSGKHIGPLKGIENYAHLRQLDFSQNSIKEIGPFKGLPHVLSLNLANNLIPNIKPLFEMEEPPFKYLEHLDLSGNALTELPVLNMGALKTANFAKNHIGGLMEGFAGHAQLKKLNLAENKLTSLENLGNMPELTDLNVSCNELTSANGLAEVPKLEVFNLAANQLASLDAPWQDIANLGSLDISGNLLASAEALKTLQQLRRLRTLGVANNPFMAGTEEVPVEGNPRIEVLRQHWRLASIDGIAVTDEELEQARELNVQKVLEEREAKKRAEEEAAAAEGGD